MTIERKRQGETPWDWKLSILAKNWKNIDDKKEQVVRCMPC